MCGLVTQSTMKTRGNNERKIERFQLNYTRITSVNMNVNFDILHIFYETLNNSSKNVSLI